MPYVATVNVPGYLPEQDDPPVFDTIAEAWAYHAEDRERDERDTGCNHGNCDETVQMLREQTTAGYVHLHSPRVDDSSTGAAWDHDLGLAYCVDWTRCDHVWVAGMMGVHPEDVDQVAAVRKIECTRCDATRGPTG